MPYIEQEKRKELDFLIETLVQQLSHYGDEGRTNYVITRIIDGVWGKGGYTDFNAGLGILEAVKAEWLRRKVAKFESKKCKLNGDVFD